MPNDRVFVSAMYDVQIEPLADRLFAVMTKVSFRLLFYYSMDSIRCPIGKASRVFFPARLIPERHDLSRHPRFMIDFPKKKLPILNRTETEIRQT